MRPIILLSVLLLAACGTTSSGPAPIAPPPVPAPFQQKSILRYGSKGRWSAGQDVLEEMFAEELKRDTALASLLERITETQRIFADSTEGFKGLHENDDRFYRSAETHANMLSDTLERQHMRQRLLESRLHAEHRFDAFTAMDSLSQDLSHEVEQLRTMIMLDRTLARMESYQRTQVPGQVGMQNALRDLRHLRDELRKKAG